jgi:cobalamin biosynthesis Mg chelatase CobN
MKLSKYLKRLLLYFSIALVAINCAPRKVDNTITKNTNTTKQQEQSSTNTSSISKDDTKTTNDAKATYKIVDSTYIIGSTKFNVIYNENVATLTIEPVDSNKKAEYDVTINGQNFKGSTNAKMTYSSSNKQTVDTSETTNSKQSSIKANSIINKSNANINTKINQTNSNSIDNKSLDSSSSFYEKTKNTLKKEPVLMYLAIILAIIVSIYFARQWLLPKP